jgi:hypothetical protein
MAGRARLQSNGARQGRDEDASSLGLPPGVHDGAAILAHHVVVPLPGLGIDGFADAAQQPQGGARSLLHGAVAVGHERADGGRSGIEDVYLVLVDHFPETRSAGVVGHTFEHHAGSAVAQGSIDDVGMTRDPAHVGGAPIHIAFLVIEHVFVGNGGI